MAVTEVLSPVGGLQLPGLFSTFTCWLPLQPQGVGVHALNNPTALDKTHRAQAAGTPAVRADCNRFPGWRQGERSNDIRGSMSGHASPAIPDQTT